jgi:hypothetical protein
MVDFMLTKNIDVNRPDVNGWTMMHVACARGHEELVVLLIGMYLVHTHTHTHTHTFLFIHIYSLFSTLFSFCL